MSSLRSYIPPHIESMHRSKSNEQSILAAGICSFVASLFANVSTGTNGFLSNVPIVVSLLLFTAIFLALYWGYVCARNRYASARFYRRKRVDKYDICHVVNDIMLNDVLNMIQITASIDDDKIRSMQYQECIYNIDTMLEFIDSYVKLDLLSECNSTIHRTGRAYSRITMHQIECILCGILFILERASNILYDAENKDVSLYHTALIDQTKTLASERFGISDIKKSIFYISTTK